MPWQEFVHIGRSGPGIGRGIGGHVHDQTFDRLAVQPAERILRLARDTGGHDAILD